MTHTPFLCPNCGTPIADALSSQLRTQLEQELQHEHIAKMNKLKQQEATISKALENIAKEKLLLEQTISEKVKSEKERLWLLAQEEAKKQSTAETASKLQQLEEDNLRKTAALKQAAEQELSLRKQKQALEERAASMELEVQRKIDAEREQVVLQTKKMAAEEHRLRMLEKEKQLEMMRQQIEELKRKSEQGSMQIQGEVQEEDLKALLQRTFPTDLIDDVEKGIRGADLVHTVRNQFGEAVGVILWESKNTKAWSDSWIKKLKDDQSRLKVDVCVIVSQSLPTTIQQFGTLDGVWVCSPECVVELTRAFRFQLIQLFQLRRSMVGRDEKMEVLYSYLSGPQFRQRIESIVSAFASLQADLDKEKRAFERMWRKREQELDRVMSHTSGMYGDLQGIIGAALPTVPALELEELSEDAFTQPNLLSSTVDLGR